MRKHIHLGRGRCVHKQHIQHHLHGSGDFKFGLDIGKSIHHGGVFRPMDETRVKSGDGKRKIQPLRFRF